MKSSFTYLKIMTVAILALLTFSPSFAQVDVPGEITHGSEYWFGVPHCRTQAGEPIRNGEFPIMLWISSKVNTKATVSSYLLGMEKTVQVNAHQTTIVELDDFYMNRESEKVEDKGIHIIAEDPITVCVYMSYKWSGEAFRCIPVEWLGKKYVTSNLYLDRTDVYKPGQILIVATEDNTTVSYIPSAPTTNIDKGKTGRVNLKRGQTFLIEGRIKGLENLNQDWSTDMSGTRISSNNPICVISGHTKAAFPRYSKTMLRTPANFMRNMLIECMWPNDLLGTEYISVPIKYFARNRGQSGVPDDFGDLIRFMPIEDDTYIYQKRQSGEGFRQISPRLKAGDCFNIDNQEVAAFYQSNKPVLVSQFGKSWADYLPTPITMPDEDDEGLSKKNKDKNLNPRLNGQGMMLVLAPIDHWCSYAQFRSPAGIDNFIYITFREEDRFKIKFDGQPIIARFGSAVRPVNGTDYVYLVETVPPGDHYFSADDGGSFACYAYGNWDRSKDGFAYGYPTGINYASKCPDSLFVEWDMECGNVTGEFWVEPEDSSCAAIFKVMYRSKDAYNYDFKVDEFDPADAKRVGFSLTVIDPKDLHLLLF